MKVALVPWSEGMKNNNIFEPLKDGRENAHTLLKKAFVNNGDDINTIDVYTDYHDVDLFLFTVIDYAILAKIYKLGLEGRCVYCSGEPVVVKPDNCAEGYKRLGDMFPYFMTVDRNAVDNERVFFRTLPYFDYPEWGSVPFEDKKLITNVSGNKHSNHPFEIYSVREELISYFESRYPDQIDSYGPGWDVDKHPSYRGLCGSKAETYHYHKFALSLENTKNVPGYITEKIFDCFKYGIVPIYWGAPDVKDYIPENCFIDYMQFANNDELAEYLTNMTEETYNGYLDNIKRFVENEKMMEPFSSEEYYRNIYYLYENMRNSDFRVTFSRKNEVIIKSLFEKTNRMKSNIKRKLHYFRIYQK